jgi:hypothetical protein
MSAKREPYVVKKVSTALDDDDLPDVDKFLMKFYTITAFVAPTNSGKTNLIVNLLNRRPFYRKKFDKIVLISSTVAIDPMWARAKGIDEAYESYNDKAVVDLIESQKKELEENERSEVPNVLLILDDVIDQIPKTSSALNSLSMRLRHYKVTCWITTQKFNRLPVALRNQVQYWILFKTAIKNELERESIAREVGSMVSEKTFMKIWEAVGEHNYNFLVVHIRSPDHKMFRREFQAYLCPKDFPDSESDSSSDSE